MTPLQRQGIGKLWRRFGRHRAAVVGLVFVTLVILAAVAAPVLAPQGYDETDYLKVLKPPSAAAPLGTDEHGRDLLSRIIYGARLSLMVGVVSVGVGLLIGTGLGVVAGYMGGWVDQAVMRLMDLMLAFPTTLLAIALMVALGPGLSKAIIAVGIVSIPTYARIARGATLSVKEEEYVLAALATGSTRRRIMLRHILPNIVSPMVVRASLGISDAILDVAALGFLGLGAQLPLPEWGALLSRGTRYFYNAPHLVIFPGLVLTLTVVSLNLLADGLRDALDPRLHR